MPESEKVQHNFFIGLLVLIIALNAMVFYPYLGSLVFALTLAVVCSSWYHKILNHIPSFPNLASFLTLLLVLVIIFVPLTFFGIMVFNQAHGLYISLANNAETVVFLNSFFGALSQDLPLGQPVSFLITNLNEYTRVFLQYVVSNATSVFAGATNIGIHMLLILLALFFFLRDGEKLKEIVIHLSPLKRADDELIFDHLGKAVNSIVRGTILLSLIQGLIASTGFLIFGVPNAALFGALTFVAAFVPGVGSALVMLPVAVYLYVFSSTGAALGMVLWSLLVGASDNFIRPKVISSGTGMHPLLVLLSVLGGISIFGTYGLLIGPLLLSFLFALADLYKKGIA